MKRHLLTLHAVRKTVQIVATSQSVDQIAASSVNPPKEALTEERQERLNVLLSYSPLLRSVWKWKEAFSAWYDSSPNHAVVLLGFERWFTQSDQIDHSAVRSILKTMRNWK
ncbi:hypothetical protein PAESOLCIP111_03513 [Paenibacillus solanacearum]|uniref:Transposase IS204/IS1001/IS1096/IS1165 DDE domain-containing protein n=1 Tax=Paenibacillus solanacearum TaxID=2048548 RepID=A0A916NR00_9BACL|nr:transposase [Paenibacillus solanacearum]CAG7633917.1 hypothetical protein PAESOLCIP111_03513 [Paenibacillus solanacearum]